MPPTPLARPAGCGELNDDQLRAVTQPAGVPLIVIGVVLGQLSSSDGGRNFCLIVLLLAAVRLTLGGGIF